MREKTKEEHKYTSTGIKFWKHPKQMENYKYGNNNTIISTHISPESLCNLNCSYCSVKKRKRSFRIELDVIKDYILKLMTSGLKAVILTGGGEPLLYPYINELSYWIKKEKGLSLALITNGTCSEKLEDWSLFSWIRVSINEIQDWENKINIPIKSLSKNTVVGCSYIDTGNLENNINSLSKMLDKLNAQYLRILPNCLLNQSDLIKEHERIDKLFKTKIKDKRFFHQYKIHETPISKICHQSYFRPYLSEINGGTVFPCDSIVLNESIEHFNEKYSICKAEDILLFLNKYINGNFNPKVDCTGCVFSENIKMLDNWVNNKIDYFEKYEKKELLHEEFV